MGDYYPIHDLIENQQRRLGMRRSELARRCGFKNVAKGIRRIDGVCHGDLDSPAAKMVLEALPAALELDKDAVETAVRATAEIMAEAERRAAAEREATWRASFMPHAYLLGTETRPSQITFYGLTGGSERWLRIRLDLSQTARDLRGSGVCRRKADPGGPLPRPDNGFHRQLHAR